MPVAFDAATTDTLSTAGVASLTSAALTVSGADRCLFGDIGTSAGGSPTTHTEMRQNGAAGTLMTQIGSTLNCGQNGRLSSWRLIAPAAASQTVYGLWAATQDETVIDGTSYTGVDQTTPVTGATTNSNTTPNATGTPQDITVTVSTPNSNELVRAVFYAVDSNGTNPTIAAQGSAVERYKVEGAQLAFQAFIVVEQVAVGASTVVTVRVSTPGTMVLTWGAIGYVVAVAGPPPPPVRIVTPHVAVAMGF